jgi:subtilisin family serine protease
MFKKIVLLCICLLLANSNNVETQSNFPSDMESENVIVAVIDSEINTEHEFLKERCLEGKEFLLNEKSKVDHGTAVAGAVVKYSQITANKLNKKSSVTIVPVEINVEDIQTDGGVLLSQAIEYAIDRGAKVINMSFSSAVPNMHVYEKIRYGIEKEVIFVSAAGNTGLDTYSFPAAYEGVISVGSCYMENGKYYKSNFSNANNDVALLVEGEKILLPDKVNYSEKTGTSYSAGALSGILGELISRTTLMIPPTPEH